MAAPGLQEPAKKALATLEREWDGLAAHRDYPMISLDNNAAERMIRGPVVTRKNAGGSRNEDSARLAATHLDRHRDSPDGRPERPDLAHRLPRRNADATAGNPPPGQRWNGSCPGPPAPTTSTPGQHHPSSPADPPGNHRRRHANRPRRLLAMPAHMTSEYVRSSSVSVGPPWAGRCAGSPGRSGRSPGRRWSGHVSFETDLRQQRLAHGGDIGVGVQELRRGVDVVVGRLDAARAPCSGPGRAASP